MAGKENPRKRNRTDFHLGASDFTFLVGMMIVAVGLIVLSIALGVGISPDLSPFAAP